MRQAKLIYYIMDIIAQSHVPELYFQTTTTGLFIYGCPRAWSAAIRHSFLSMILQMTSNEVVVVDSVG